MVRGVTESEVFEACDAVVARGERPTIERARMQLGGRGSTGTINRHLDAWWKRLNKRLRPLSAGDLELPPHLAQLADQIWNLVYPVAADEAASAIASQRAALADEMAAFDQERESLSGKVVELERALAVAENELQLSYKTIADRGESVARLERQVRAITKQLEDERGRASQARTTADKTIAELQARLKAEVQARVEDRRRSASELKAKSTELNRLKRERSQQQTLTEKRLAAIAESIETLQRPTAGKRRARSKKTAHAQ